MLDMPNGIIVPCVTGVLSSIAAMVIFPFLLHSTTFHGVMETQTLFPYNDLAGRVQGQHQRGAASPGLPVVGRGERDPAALCLLAGYFFVLS